MSRNSDLVEQRLSWSELGMWAVMALAVVFLCLGGLFIVYPTAGAAIFGIPAPSGVSAGYLRAIGFRDVALALYLAGLACFSTRRAVCLVLMASVFIPFCDVILVWMSGSAAAWQIALHGVSGAGLVGIAAWISLTSRRARLPQAADGVTPGERAGGPVRRKSDPPNCQRHVRDQRRQDDLQPR